MSATNTYGYLCENFGFIEDTIGYRFRDRNLLVQAFTSKSFGAENPSFLDNDVLEFYGDAELYKFMSDWLFDSYTVYPDGKRNNQLSSEKSVGQLSEIRKNYINKKTLARCLRLKQLDQFVLLGKSDLNNNAADSDSILEDVFEALIGAVKVDSEGKNNNYSLIVGYGNSKDALKTVCHNLFEMIFFEKDWLKEIMDFCNYYEVEPHFQKSGYLDNWTCYLTIPRMNIKSEGKGKTFEIARMSACQNAMHDCDIYDMKQDVGEADYDNAVSQLNMLFQKEYITKPEYKFECETQSDGRQLWSCYCYVSDYEDKPNYDNRGIGEEYSKNEAKKTAAYDMLCFIYDEENDNVDDDEYSDDDYDDWDD